MNPATARVACLALFALGILSAPAHVYVDSLEASRRAGTDQIEISFRLNAPQPLTYPVAREVVLTVSSGGTPLTVTAVTGDLGSDVAVGADKMIVWDAGADGGLPSGPISITVRATSRAPWHGDPNAISWEVVHEDWVRNEYQHHGDTHYTLSNRERGVWVDHLYILNPYDLFNGYEASDEFASLQWSGYANTDYEWLLPTHQQLTDMEPYAHLFVGTSQYEMRNLHIWTYSMGWGVYEYMWGYDWHGSSEWPFEIVEEDEYFEECRAALWPVYPSGQPWDTPLPTWDDEDTVTIEIEATASDFEYEIAPGGGATIISYTGDGGAVILDATLGGEPVVAIGADAFADAIELDSLMIPASIAYIGDGAFAGSGIGRLLFRGDAPTLGQGVFDGSSLIIYRRFGTTGWGDTLGGRPVELWRAELKTGSGIGMGPGGFGFAFNGPPEDLAEVQVYDGSDGSWKPVQSLELSFDDHEYVDPEPGPTGIRLFRVLLRYE